MAKYLDRDDVLNVIEYIRTKYISVYNRRDKCSQFWADTIRYFEKRINKLDDYDVVPVRHAKWVLIDECVNEGVYCSNCHKKIYRAEYANQKVKSNYCPNCGAKMDSNEVE